MTELSDFQHNLGGDIGNFIMQGFGDLISFKISYASGAIIIIIGIIVIALTDSYWKPLIHRR